MTRIMRSTSSEGDWCAVTRKNPCQLCGSVEGLCSASEDEFFLCCAQHPSDWLLANGAWLHRMPAQDDRAPDRSLTLLTGSSQADSTR